ncbi:MAG TPA: outer membrane beta-barrel protein [Verrucomicrobiae bacterium]|jgi:hypothetical protein|nr:outer membrane beta-barrel protein [Verrucomicrobiae bacterium]
MKRAIASASLLALGAAGATAQLITADKPWSISGSLRGFYDDNINTQPAGPAKVSSFGIEVVPGAAVNFNTGPTTLTGSLTYDNRYYFERRNTDQSLDFEFDLNHNFSARYSTEFTESFVVAQEPEVLANGGAVTTPLRSNGNNIHNVIGLTFQAQLTRLFGLVLGYNNSIYSYEENAGNTVSPGIPSRSALLDVVQHTFTVDSTWALSDKTRGIFGYKFSALFNTSDESVINDPNGPPFTDGYPYGGEFYIPADTRNSYTQYVYVGADETFSSALSGSIRVGLQYLDYYNNGTLQGVAPNLVFVRDGSTTLSPYADLSLNYAYNEAGLLTFGFHQGHNQTDVAASAGDPNAGVTVDEDSSTVYLTVKQKLTPITPKLTASGSLQYQYSVFNGGPSNDETDSFYMLGLDLSYQFNPHLSADTGYNLDILSSDLAGRGYSRNQVFVGVTAAY